MHGEVVSPKPGACPVCGMPLVDAESLHGKRASGSDLPLVVPAPAVLWTGTRSLVYVRVPGPDPVFEGREIVLGPRAGGVYLVREGLEEGERVVTRGAFKIDASLQIQGQPSMMTLEPQPEPEPESRPESRPTSRPSDSEEKGARNPGTQEEEEKTSSVRGRLGPALDAYFGLHRDLAGDRASGGKRGPELAKALDKIEPGDVVADERADWTRLARALRATANAVGRAKTLKAQRKAFESVATALTELLHRFGYPDGRSVYRYHCPMAFKRGADWLQEVDKTENPYFGSRMFRCGKRVEALEAGGAK
jgi:Cu(I)/Ag(I) efflux system membrane fusion protein